MGSNRCKAQVFLSYMCFLKHRSHNFTTGHLFNFSQPSARKWEILPVMNHLAFKSLACTISNDGVETVFAFLYKNIHTHLTKFLEQQSALTTSKIKLKQSEPKQNPNNECGFSLWGWLKTPGPWRHGSWACFHGNTWRSPGDLKGETAGLNLSPNKQTNKKNTCTN